MGLWITLGQAESGRVGHSGGPFSRATASKLEVNRYAVHNPRRSGRSWAGQLY